MQNMHIWTARVVTSKIKLIYETKQKNWKLLLPLLFNLNDTQNIVLEIHEL